MAGTSQLAATSAKGGARAPSSVEIFYRALRTGTQRIGGLIEVWPAAPVAVRDRTVALVSEFFT